MGHTHGDAARPDGAGYVRLTRGRCGQMSWRHALRTEYLKAHREWFEPCARRAASAMLEAPRRALPSSIETSMTSTHPLQSALICSSLVQRRRTHTYRRFARSRCALQRSATRRALEFSENPILAMVDVWKYPANFPKHLCVASSDFTLLCNPHQRVKSVPCQSLRLH